MKKLNNIIIKLKDDIYYAEILIIIGDHNYYQNQLKEIGVKEIEKQKNWGGETPVWMNDDTGDRTYTVWFPDITFTSVNYGVIVHEFLHLAFRVFENIGIKLDYNNQEPVAYYQEYLFAQFLDKAFKKYRKNK